MHFLIYVILNFRAFTFIYSFSLLSENNWLVLLFRSLSLPIFVSLCLPPLSLSLSVSFSHTHIHTHTHTLTDYLSKIKAWSDQTALFGQHSVLRTFSYSYKLFAITVPSFFSPRVRTFLSFSNIHLNTSIYLSRSRTCFLPSTDMLRWWLKR